MIGEEGENIVVQEAMLLGICLIWQISVTMLHMIFLWQRDYNIVEWAYWIGRIIEEGYLFLFEKIT